MKFKQIHDGGFFWLVQWQFHEAIQITGKRELDHENGRGEIENGVKGNKRYCEYILSSHVELSKNTHTRDKKSQQNNNMNKKS